MRGVFLPWTDRTDEPPRSVVQDLDLASTRSIPGFVEQHGEVWFVGAPVSFDGGLDEAFARDDAVVPTRPGDRHLTLVYLGRVPSDDVMGVWRALPRLSLPEHVRPLGWERFGRRAIALSLADDDGRLRAAADACFDVAAAQLTQFQRPSRRSAPTSRSGGRGRTRDRRRRRR